MSTGDTLIYKVDLDNDYAVQYLEENGLAPIDWQIENVIREQKHE